MLRRFGFLSLLLALSVGSSLAYDTCTGTGNLDPQGVLGQPVGPGNLSGCLTAAGHGLTTDPAPTPWGDFTIAWQITPATGGYRYQYTFSDPFSPQKDISHVVIGLSLNCRTDNGCIWDVDPTSAGIDTWGDEGNSSPGIPGLLWGVKFNTSGDPTTFSVAFTSNRIPVWQNVYAKDGNYENGWTYVYNTGFGINSGLSSYYIAAPDSVVPEPGFYGMLAAGLSGLYLALRRRRAA